MNDKFKKVFKVVAICVSLAAFTAAVTGFVKMRRATQGPKLSTSAVQNTGVLAEIEKKLIVS